MHNFFFSYEVTAFGKPTFGSILVTWRSVTGGECVHVTVGSLQFWLNKNMSWQNAELFSWSNDFQLGWKNGSGLVFLLFQQMYFAIAKNTFCNLDKYILQVMTISWDELSFVWDGKHCSGLWSDIQPCLVARWNRCKEGAAIWSVFH